MNFNNVVANRKNKVICRDGDKLVKLFDESYSVANVLNEALNQARIMETGLNIPSLQEVSKVDSKWVIAMDYIDGKTIEQLIAENPDKTDDYLKLFVDSQVEIHTKHSNLLRKLHDKMESKIDKLNLSDSVKFDLKSKLAGLKKHNKVLHGDYQLSNVIVSDNGKVYVVDWAHATQGNASADAAMSYLLMKLNKKYGLAEKYLDSERNLMGMLSLLLQYLPLFGMIFLQERYKIRQKIDFTPIVMGVVVIYAFSMNLTGLNRLVNYFIPFILIYTVNTVYYMISNIKVKFTLGYTALAASLSVLCFNYYYYYAKDVSDAYPNTRFYTIFYPYSSVFSPEQDEHRERFIENYRDVLIQF